MKIGAKSIANHVDSVTFALFHYAVLFFPKTRTPDSVRADGHPNQHGEVSCSRSRGDVVLFRDNIGGAHVLPARGRVTVHESESSSLIYRMRQGAEQEFLLKADMSHARMLFTVFRQEDVIDKGGMRVCAVTWSPDSKAQTLNAAVSALEEVGGGLYVRSFGQDYAA